MNQYLNFSLEGKVALVTGASYGIGFRYCICFCRTGRNPSVYKRHQSGIGG